MENYRFSRRWLFIDNFFDMKNTENDSIVFSSSNRFEICIFDIERLIPKFDLRSGQVKVRSRSGQDRSRPICISPEAA